MKPECGNNDNFMSYNLIFIDIVFPFICIDPKFSGFVQVLLKQNNFINVGQMSENLKSVVWTVS